MADSPDGGALQWSLGGGTVVKVESETVAMTPSHANELHFLRTRVQELEKDKAELMAENQQLRNTLVNEIPGFLSTMWQMLGQVNTHQPVATATAKNESYAPYPHPRAATDQEAEFGGPRPERAEPSGDPADFCPPGPRDGTGVEAPLCPQTDMEELRRSCSESQCTARDHVSQVEVYPGSGVLCDVHSWQAANQAPSPTAMARMLLVGVFDMATLMNSNLRGGQSRRPASHTQRSALDPHKTNAIFNAILARFPFARKGVIGSGINSKLSEIRFHSRRANRDPHYL